MKQLLLIADKHISSDGIRQLARKLSGTVQVESIRWPVNGRDLLAALDRCQANGAESIALCPLVLMPSDERLEKLAEQVATWAGSAKVTLAPLRFGFDLTDLVQARVAAAFDELTDGSRPLLSVTGLVATPQNFTYSDLCRLAEQIPDVSTVAPGRDGGGVWLRAILEHVGPLPEAEQAVFVSDGDGFSATVPLAEASEKGFLIYSTGEAPLPVGRGGPTRLLIPGADDRCANVKGVNRIELSGE